MLTRYTNWWNMVSKRFIVFQFSRLQRGMCNFFSTALNLAPQLLWGYWDKISVYLFLWVTMSPYSRTVDTKTFSEVRHRTTIEVTSSPIHSNFRLQEAYIETICRTWKPVFFYLWDPHLLCRSNSSDRS